MWPNTQSFDCENGKGYKVLNENLESVDIAKCEYLCMQEAENGCCFLNDKYGCSWKPNGTRFKGGEKGLAITCSILGMHCVYTHK